MIEAKIICDSVGPNGKRITTFVLKYPRFIHAELLTHRMFSRNAASSRAIPIEREIASVKNDLASPISFRANQKGMQAGPPLSEEKQRQAKSVWLQGAENACHTAKALSDLGVHKEIANRVLEPFLHITTILTATEFKNFFALRNHKDAQAEIAELAKQMYELLQTTQPTKLETGEWHIPFCDDELVNDTWNYAQDVLKAENPQEKVDQILLKRSVAKCARVSYNNHDGTKTTIEQDIALYDRLVSNSPIHASPAEHQAMCLSEDSENFQSGNFKGWIQYRKTLPNENVTI